MQRSTSRRSTAYAILVACVASVWGFIGGWVLLVACKSVWPHVSALIPTDDFLRDGLLAGLLYSAALTFLALRVLVWRSRRFWEVGGLFLLAGLAALAGIEEFIGGERYITQLERKARVEIVADVTLSRGDREFAVEFSEQNGDYVVWCSNLWGNRPKRARDLSAQTLAEIRGALDSLIQTWVAHGVVLT